MEYLILAEFFLKLKSENKAETRVSFWGRLAKQRKPFMDGELIKYLIPAVEEMCSESINLYQMISLLVRTLAQNIENIDSNVNS